VGIATFDKSDTSGGDQSVDFHHDDISHIGIDEDLLSKYALRSADTNIPERINESVSIEIITLKHPH
jgi:hypothetical protein